jgi:hypothetical protein
VAAVGCYIQRDINNGENNVCFHVKNSSCACQDADTHCNRGTQQILALHDACSLIGRWEHPKEEVLK